MKEQEYIIQQSPAYRIAIRTNGERISISYEHRDIAVGIYGETEPRVRWLAEQTISIWNNQGELFDAIERISKLWVLQ